MKPCGGNSGPGLQIGCLLLPGTGRLRLPVPHPAPCSGLCKLCGFEVEFEFVFWSVFVPPTYSHNSDCVVA